ncbi:NADPH-dependent FMN reductase [Acinetobacter haemolyticus]|uniref:NADPH-dependent FMN reductase n=1 Tax=Acinetobacter haemolyticus TaxID=29430 RepID=UPI000E18AF87|nr:NAD(P)H-dependent oxidoreductase [Acinetobacter haemolyticus]NAR57336.1 NADPH-dependent oxidoreductase [Acinetobacter haemolyticus]NAS02006.1 NADPH-dependent oxidoreductase [Acinetobacter haemolyticus]QHI34132.1 NADPH-dependent oxidoreductase [Acinetobacter haemolyticus]SUU07823.1 flavoprotein [Acinetobacter haemolyticus]
MLIYIIVGSVREGRTAIKVANWVQQATNQLAIEQIQTEIIDLKQWNLPLFAGAHPPASGIYDQPKQQEWADKIAAADAFIFISPEYNHGYSPALKNALDYLGKEWQGKPAAYIGYGATNGSRSISQIRQVASSLGIVDPNAVMEIRDIFKRNKEENFEANEFEVKGLKAMLEKLQKYHSA